MNKLSKKYWAFRNWFRNSIFEPIWYRFFGHKFHIVRTKLPPSPWYDTNIRMLYAVMGLVEWFVENDMRIWSQEDRDKEFKRIREEDTEDYRDDYCECLEDQFANDDKIIEVYKWWKNYAKREDEIEKALDDWATYNSLLREKPDDFFSKKRTMTEGEVIEENRLLDRYDELKNKLINEEKKYMKMAVDLREYMWS